MENHTFTNRLIHESSPYLQQHAHNPVDWYPWGQEALRRAIRERRPILLSVGYSACHWCHVMERESFEDVETARLMNDHFVNIKVDREERPDIDRVYQTAAQIISGQGGWPLTVFLTPDQKPFYAGTYFPPRDRYGRPGFKRVLHELAKLWEDAPEQIEELANEITKAIQEEIRYNPREITGPAVAAGLPSTAAIRKLKRAYDPDNGGFGTAPKFPNINILNLFLQRSTTQPELLQIVTRTLSKMARGGIYDQLGGGFHRYSTDARWLVPHFEKMLYDNALLASLYLDVYQETKDQEFRGIAIETLDYILRDMTAPEGGFFSSEDADSEGEEGKFYVWRRDEILHLLGEESGDLVCRYYGVSQEGNFEGGTSILYRDIDIEELAKERGLNTEKAKHLLEDGRRKLMGVRQKRVRPGRDEKIITAWNGMMISALARAGRILGEERYTGAALKAAEFAMANLRLEDGSLRRIYKDGSGSIPGFLEDYAYLTAGLIDLYETTFDYRWLRESQRLTDLMIKLFWSDEKATFFDSPDDRHQLFLRPQNPVDESFPSGMSIAARNLLLLSTIRDERGDDDSIRKVEILLGRYKHDMEQNPWGFASLLSVADLYRNGVTQIVIVVGDEVQESQEARSRMAWLKSNELLRVVNDIYIPGLVLLGPPPKDLNDPELPEVWKGKTSVNGKSTVYICRGFSCSTPITDAQELRQYLKNARVRMATT
ncbi:MAG TPA: thioredoxin domain-containing protein [Firmicutes bacterium]|nr:thioredoxin domain-containing protein [Bacillota bacterium]